MKKYIRHTLGSLGLEVRRVPPKPLAQIYREHILEKEGIRRVYDIGTSDGRYGEELREGGFTGEIFSFEPQKQAFVELEKRVEGDSSWQAFQVALGDRSGTLDLNISANKDSSSILPILDTHVNAAPDSSYVSKESVALERLDYFLKKQKIVSVPSFMKLDTQGFEREVLLGSEEILDSVSALQIELSLLPLYEGQATIHEMLVFLQEKGYHMIAHDRGFTNLSTGEILQLECIFVRNDYPYGVS